MKKYLFVILAIAIIVTGCKKEQGEIETITEINSKEFFSRNEEVIDRELYSALSSCVYFGRVGTSDMYVVFSNEDSNLPRYTNYECSVFRIKDNEEATYNSRTRYEVLLNQDGMTLNYIIGPEEETYDCSYQNGDLVMNGSTLEKLPFDTPGLARFLYIEK